MYNTLAAKAVIMVMDAKVSVSVAIDTVLGDMPWRLKAVMKKALAVEVELIIHGECEIIDLTEEELIA